MERVKSVNGKTDFDGQSKKVFLADKGSIGRGRKLEIWKAFELDYKVDWCRVQRRHLDEAA